MLTWAIKTESWAWILTFPCFQRKPFQISVKAKQSSSKLVPKKQLVLPHSILPSGLHWSAHWKAILFSLPTPHSLWCHWFHHFAGHFRERSTSWSHLSSRHANRPTNGRRGQDLSCGVTQSYTRWGITWNRTLWSRKPCSQRLSHTRCGQRTVLSSDNIQAPPPKKK